VVAYRQYRELIVLYCRRRLFLTRARPALIAAGLATEDEIDRHLGDLDRTDLDIAVFPIVSAWGRQQPDKPSTIR
jgi:hypothetical protein